jgi:hypothetical protein
VRPAQQEMTSHISAISINNFTSKTKVKISEELID